MLDLSAHDLLERQARGDITAEAITTAYLDNIRRTDGRVRAFLHVDEESALASARAVDVRRKAGEKLGALAGIPVAVKDVLCTAGRPTTCGSKILRNFVPPYDAHVITRLKEHDAVLIGKTNLDEFAMGSSTENSRLLPGGLGNPAGPGADSPAASAALPPRSPPACCRRRALGSDTGGSIRLPASLCGVVGLKPTYGRVSRFGLIAYGSSLDQVGPFAQTVERRSPLARSHRRPRPAR